MSNAENPLTPPRTARAGRTLLRRLAPLVPRRLPRGRWTQTIVGIALLVVIIGLGATWTLLQTRKQQREARAALLASVDEAVQLLEAGEYEQARRLAAELRVADLTFEQLGSPVYVLGATLVHDADEHWNPTEQRKQYLIGSRYLEEARARSFPEGREAQGQFLMAKSMLLGGRTAESIPALQKALELNPKSRSQIHRYLALAYLRDKPSRPKEALPHLDEYLADRLLSTADRLEGWRQRAEITLELNNLPECRRSLDEILTWESQQQTESGLPAAPQAASNRRDKSDRRRIATTLRDAVILNGRLAIRVADQADPAQAAERQAAYEQARDALAALVPQGRDTPESEYLLGIALRKLGDQTAAREQLSRTARRAFGTPEGFAAQLDLAQLEQELGEHAAALENMVSALKEVRDPTAYANRWLSLDELRERVLVYYANRLDARAHSDAIQLADVMHPLFPEDQAAQAQATVYANWGGDLARRAEASNYAEAVGQLAEAEQHFRQAGQIYKHLSQLHFSQKDYTDNLWLSAENYLLAHDNRRGADVIRTYLQYEPRRRRPRALTLLGEALLALGDIPAARQHFEQCIAAYPKDPDSYRARIGAANAALELGQLPEAERLLADNLESLTPNSAEWRDSLFLLGEILHRKGTEILTRSRDDRANALLDETARRNAERALQQADAILEEAITRLTLAVLRYPADPRNLRSRYLIADSFRHRSKLPQWKLGFETITSRQNELEGRKRANLDAAYQHYNQLVEDLDRKQDAGELSPIEKNVQRNCYFIRAHTLYDLDRFQDALAAYSTATNRYASEPASLEAYEQIAACYRHLGDPAKARGTLEHAKIVIANLPTNVDYSRTTRYTRDEWLKLLQ